MISVFKKGQTLKKNMLYAFVLNKYYYPGNNISNLPIYEIYSKIESHFKKIPNQGCFVCLYKNDLIIYSLECSK